MSEYEQDRHIDLNKLEWECARQSELYNKWGKRWAKACKKRDRLAERVKTKRSDLLEDVRINYIDYGYSKEPTGPQAEAFYRINDEYKIIKRKWLKAEANARVMWVAIRSLEHKKDMLEVEQRLYAQDYYSLPYIEPEYEKKTETETRGDHQDQLTDNNGRVGKRLTRRSDNGIT